MPTALELKQERGRVWNEILDLRGKKVDGKFADAAAETHYRNADAKFTDLTTQIQEQELHEAREREMVATEIAARERTPQNASTTQGGAIDYDGTFWRYMTRPREGRLSDNETRLLETRGTSTQISSTDSLGGYTVPQQFSNTLESRMLWFGGMMEACGLMPSNVGGTLKYPSIDDTGTTGAIIGQGVGGTVADATFGNVLFTDYTVYSKIIKLGLEYMTDEQVGFVQQVLGDLLPNRIGRKANSLLTNGTGTSEPYGLTTTVTNSALTTAGATAITKVELIRAQHSIDKSYRMGPKAGWMMHDTIMAYLRTLDVGNTDTVQIFTPSLVGGEPDRLLGKPIFINNDLEAANVSTRLPVTAKKHIYVGDFDYFKIRRIGGISLSRNDSKYWDERAVGFMGWIRLDSNLIQASAIKSILQA